MKKTTLIVILVLTAMLMQYCNKDSISQTADSTSTVPAEAFINDTTWTPTSYTATVTYNAASQTKTLTFTGVMGTQQLNFTSNQPNSSSVGNGFPVNTFNVDASSKLTFTYGLQTSGSSTFVTQGVATAGYLTIAAVDSVNMKITGTFGFNTTQKIYDINGNLVSIYVNQISSGEFNGIPYTYKKN